MQHSWFHGIQQGCSLAHDCLANAPSCQMVLSGVDANDHFFFFWLGPLWEDFQASIISYHMNSEGLHTVSWCMFKIFRYNTFLQNNCPCWSVIQRTLSNYFSMNSLISWKLLQKQTFRSVTRTLILERYVTLEFFRTPSFFNDVGTNSVQLCGIGAQQKSQRQKYLRVRYH